MKLTLRRTWKSETYTIGHLYIDGVYFCDTIEDKDRGLKQTMPLSQIQERKVYGLTAIPLGTYGIDMDIVSPRFMGRSWAKPWGGRLPRLRNVPGFSGVLIHVGNTAEDTLGCILVGVNSVKGKVMSSTATFTKLMERMTAAHQRGESISITIQ